MEYKWVPANFQDSLTEMRGWGRAWTSCNILTSYSGEEVVLLSCMICLGNQNLHDLSICLCSLVVPSMPDLVKLVEVLPQRAPCHQQIQVDLTRHFHHHLRMVGAAFIPESVHFSITPTEMCCYCFFQEGPSQYMLSVI